MIPLPLHNLVDFHWRHSDHCWRHSDHCKNQQQHNTITTHSLPAIGWLLDMRGAMGRMHDDEYDMIRISACKPFSPSANAQKSCLNVALYTQ